MEPNSGLIQLGQQNPTLPAGLTNIQGYNQDVMREVLNRSLDQSFAAPRALIEPLLNAVRTGIINPLGSIGQVAAQTYGNMMQGQDLGQAFANSPIQNTQQILPDQGQYQEYLQNPLLGGAKAGASFGAYAAPGLLSPLLAGASPAVAGGLIGAGSGALGGFGQSRAGNELRDTGIGAGVGGVAGAALGALSQYLSRMKGVSGSLGDSTSSYPATSGDSTGKFGNIYNQESTPATEIPIVKDYYNGMKRTASDSLKTVLNQSGDRLDIARQQLVNTINSASDPVERSIAITDLNRLNYFLDESIYSDPATEAVRGMIGLEPTPQQDAMSKMISAYSSKFPIEKVNGGNAITSSGTFGGDPMTSIMSGDPELVSDGIRSIINERSNAQDIINAMLSDGLRIEDIRSMSNADLAGLLGIPSKVASRVDLSKYAAMIGDNIKANLDGESFAEMYKYTLPNGQPVWSSDANGWITRTKNL